MISRPNIKNYHLKMSRSNFLREIESNVQKKWGRTEFEANAPESYDEKDKKKFFVTFPFPYSNSVHHLGHVFSLLKADIMARYHKNRGFNILFPFAYHLTGIPIPAAANRLAAEIKTGTPGKQYEALIKADIPENLIPNFVDPVYWTRYFPKISLEQDLPALGCAIDYRRSFITTNLNPYFDSFVKWQFNQLNAKGYLKFGKKMVIYSEKDGQPCSDADRSVGEGVEIRELRVALYQQGQNMILVTFDESAPVDSIVCSEKIDPSTYTTTTNPDMKIIMQSECYRNMRHQRYRDIIPIENIDSELLDFAKCKLTHGSGYYTSNPNLEWFVYYEPAAEVVSRSGDRCVVAETDQWFIMYDNPQWRDSVYHHVNTKVKFTDPIVKTTMLETIGKSHPWPFSRTFGLGTKIPFDEKYLIDSLSDSTIYMAFYTVAHLVGEIPIDQLSDDVWNSIFFGSETVVSRKYPEVFDKMRREFRYWYPLDLRVSGKDLITNHLTMMFFNHMAIFGAEYMPKMLYANGHIMVNGEKMSKSRGNFITLQQAIQRYGVDVTRFICATGGDDTSDANFQDAEVANTVLAMYAEIQNWSKMDFAKMRAGNLEFYDQLHLISLAKILNDVERAYNEMKFRDIAKIGFFELQNVRNKYLNPHREVLQLFLQTQLAVISPFIPHWAEYMSNTYKIPIAWPKIQIDVQYDNAKTQWLYKYCQILQSKVGEKIKKIQKRNAEYKCCRLIINKEIDKYLTEISKCDVNNKEQRRDLLKKFTNRRDNTIVIELFSHLDKFSPLFNKNDMMNWLTESHDTLIASFMAIFYPQYKYEVAYSSGSDSDPLNPVVEFY